MTGPARGFKAAPEGGDTGGGFEAPHTAPPPIPRSPPPRFSPPHPPPPPTGGPRGPGAGDQRRQREGNGPAPAADYSGAIHYAGTTIELGGPAARGGPQHSPGDPPAPPGQTDLGRPGRTDGRTQDAPAAPGTDGRTDSRGGVSWRGTALAQAPPVHGG